MRLLIAMLALLAAPPAHADAFGGWKFAAPAGHVREESTARVLFTQVDGSSFCRFGLLPARPPTADDVASEWKSVVESNYRIKAAGEPVALTTRRGMAVVMRTATLAEKGGKPFAAALYVLQPKGATGSVLLMASDEATLARCPVRPLLDSMALVAAPLPAAAPARPVQPAAAADADVAGAWGTSGGNPTLRSGTGSVLRRQYRFQPDGSYTYFSELFDGVGQWIHVRESGRYEVSGDRLTVAPTTSTISARDWNAVKSTKPQPLERVTYTFRKHYFSGLKEWNLVLTPPRPTERDGPYAVNAQFPNSYLLSNTFKPEWKWP